MMKTMEYKANKPKEDSNQIRYQRFKNTGKTIALAGCLAGIVALTAGCKTIRYDGIDFDFGAVTVYNTRKGLLPEIDGCDAMRIKGDLRLRELRGDERIRIHKD